MTLRAKSPDFRRREGDRIAVSLWAMLRSVQLWAARRPRSKPVGGLKVIVGRRGLPWFPPHPPIEQ